MTADELINIATALRGLGARKVEVTADGGLSVEFGPMPRVDASDAGDESDIVNDKRKLSPEELERLQDEADAEYIPGG